MFKAYLSYNLPGGVYTLHKKCLMTYTISIPRIGGWMDGWMYHYGYCPNCPRCADLPAALRLTNPLAVYYYIYLL